MIEFINANCNDSDISEMLTGAKISLVTYKRWKKKIYTKHMQLHPDM